MLAASRYAVHVHRQCLYRPVFYGLRCLSHLSRSHLHPAIRDFASTLAQKQPCFAVSPNKIRVLSHPTQFYTLLLDMIRRAQTRIFISSLYIGSAESELIETLHSALHRKPSLHLYLQLDLNRSTRPGPTSTAHLLLPLLRAFPSRVHVSLFRSPSLRGLLAKLVPPRFNEGWGTWHAKVYGADDEVMISGANLNKSYFTDRQDRYIHFAAQPALAQYCFSFLQTVSTFSYKLLPSSSSPATPPSAHSYHHEEYTLHWPDPHTHPHYIHRKAETALSAFQSSHISPSSNSGSHSDPSDANKIMISPVIQAGQFNVREEETAVALLFRHLNSYSKPTPHSTPDSNLSPIPSATPPTQDLSPRPLIDLTSGYFGLYKPYQDLILASAGVDCRIVAASPKANGFFGSKGISGRIPEGYTLLEQRFMKAVRQAQRKWLEFSSSTNGGDGDKGGRGVQLNEWEKEGWTYHAKGIWLSPTSTSSPILTLFGSTNLNSRSAHLDTELSFLMILPSESSPTEGSTRSSDSHDNSSALALRHALATEVKGLRTHAREWRGDERKVRFGTKVIVGLVGGML